ncbi:MAG: iron-sulfur cluster carrier protein ApbC [Betaproteobacteria bacterium]|nr:iron-sulfur cluster carrier protein ApbC [Betaproteobacteria bacterium]
MTPSEDHLRDLLRSVVDPNTGKDLVSSKSLKRLRIDQTEVSVDIELGYPARTQIEVIRGAVEQALQACEGLRRVSVHVYQRIVAHAFSPSAKPIASVRNVIAVASGKGGVGKSTTAVNLALALAYEGARVGILDADIYGPSQPTMLGLSGKPKSRDGKTMEPHLGHGLQVNSIGFLIAEDTPMIWRGPMATQALEQLIRDTRWDDLDYLVVDMPPGTGDIHLTLAQKIPVTGAIIVTTPQDIALLDARKGLKMFEKVGIPVLGLVENMAMHQCSGCGRIEHIFGDGGGVRMAEQYQVPYLGALPLEIKIRQQSDEGCPTVAAEPESAIAQSYRSIARKLAVALAAQAQSHASKFPSIVVQNT